MVRIRYEGKNLECRADTSVAAALWENGVRHLSHSPKYGRPRGVTCARGHCTACLMRVDGIPNVRVCEMPVRDGMEIQPQDAGAFYAAPMQKILSAGDSLFPVGFYYKWFTRPPFLSRMFLNGIRPMTGVGRVPVDTRALRALPAPAESSNQQSTEAADLGRYDTIVVGGGPAGLAAAAEAAGRVLLVDDHTEPGGQRYPVLRRLVGDPATPLDRFGFLRSALDRIEAARTLTGDLENLTFLQSTRSIAGYNPDGILLRREGRLKTVRFDTLVWAAGALDTLGLYPGNDTPGLLGPRALYRLLVRDSLNVRGMQVLVIGSGLDFWLSAALLGACGARPNLVLTEDDGLSGVPAAVELGWPLHTGLKLDGLAGQGEDGLKASFSPSSGKGTAGSAHMEMEAALAVVCRRGKPAYDVPYQLGADLTLQPELGGFTLSSSELYRTGAISCTLPDGAALTAVGEAAGHLPGRKASPADEGESS
jgi:sarcosine oxidase subunit alpha